MVMTLDPFRTTISFDTSDQCCTIAVDAGLKTAQGAVNVAISEFKDLIEKTDIHSCKSVVFNFWTDRSIVLMHGISTFIEDFDVKQQLNNVIFEEIWYCIDAGQKKLLWVKK